MENERFEQGQSAGRTVYQTFPNLTTTEQAEKAYEQLCSVVGEHDARLMGEERSDFMMGFGSGYYRASQVSRIAPMEREELIEKLAEKEHESWSHWMKYLFSKCTNNDDGSMTIPTDLVDRWHTQARTPYADLSEREKQSDRNRVALILPLIEAYGHKQQLIRLLSLKLSEAEQNSERATEWHARALLTEQELQAMYQVSKAANQAALLQNLLDEIDGAERSSLWSL